MVATLRSRKYHHGDLRQAVLDAAFRLLHSGGIGAVTLRAIAREIGVTHAAVYHHFADQRGVLLSLAHVAYARFADALTPRRGARRTAAERLHDVGVAYVMFAIRHPTDFRLAFSPSLDEVAADPQLQQHGERALGAFLCALSGSAAPPTRELPTHAIAAWSTVHGLAMLLSERRLALPVRTDRAIARWVRNVLETVHYRNTADMGRPPAS